MKYIFYDLYEWLKIRFDQDVQPLYITSSDNSPDLKPLSAWSIALDKDSQRKLALVAGSVLVISGLLIMALSIAATFFTGGTSLFGLFIADAIFGAGLSLMGGVAISYSRKGVLPSFNFSNLCKTPRVNDSVSSTDSLKLNYNS